MNSNIGGAVNTSKDLQRFSSGSRQDQPYNRVTSEGNLGQTRQALTITANSSRPPFQMNQIKRQSISSYSPTIAPNLQTSGQFSRKSNAYIGYMQLQNLAGQTTQSLKPNQVVTMINQSKSERSLEYSSGIAGVTINPPPAQASSARMKQIKRKNNQVGMALTQRIQVIQLDTNQAVPIQEISNNLNLPRENMPQQFTGQTYHRNGGFKRKLSKEATTGFNQFTHPLIISPALLTIGSPNALIKNQSRIQSSYQPQPNGPSIIQSNIMQLLKANETRGNRTRQAPNQPGQSRSKLASVFAATTIYGQPSATQQTLNTSKSVSGKGKQQMIAGSVDTYFDIEDQGAGKSVERKKKKLIYPKVVQLSDFTDGQHIMSLQTTENDVSPGILLPSNDQLKTLSQSPPAHYHAGMRTYLPQSSAIHLSNSRVRQQTSLRAIPKNQTLEEVKEDAAFIGQNQGSWIGDNSLGRKFSQPVHFKNNIIKISQSHVRKRGGSQLRRGSINNNTIQNNLLSKSSLSASNLHESASIERSGNNFSVTQRSIRIYRNAVNLSADKTSSINKSGINQQSLKGRQPTMIVVALKTHGSKTSRGVLAHHLNLDQDRPIGNFQVTSDENMGELRSQGNVGFIDRTIQTSTSQQLISTKNIQTGKVAESTTASQQQNQFFNNPVSTRSIGESRKSNSKIQTTKTSILQNSKVILHFEIRSAFKHWCSFTRKSKYCQARKELLEQLGSNFDYHKSHMFIIQLSERLQSLSFFKELSENNNATTLIINKITTEGINLLKMIISESKKSDKLQIFTNKIVKESLQQMIRNNSSSLQYGDKLCLQIMSNQRSLAFSQNLEIHTQTIEQVIKALAELVSHGKMYKVTFDEHYLRDQIISDVKSCNTYIEKMGERLVEILDNYALLEDDQVLWSRMTGYIQVIDECLSPYQNNLLTFIRIENEPLRQQLLSKVLNVINGIEERVIAKLEQDTACLSEDLSRSINIMRPQPQTNQLSLNGYVEQMNTVKVLNQAMCKQLIERLAQIKSLSAILERGPNKVTQSIQSTMKSIDSYMQQLPLLIRDCSDRLNFQRPQIEIQMHQGCATLTQKILSFEQKYLERYVNSWESKIVQNDLIQMTLSEIKMREKMIDEIKVKCNLYMECIDIIGLNDTFKRYKDVTFFEDLNRLEALHLCNMTLWTYICEWKSFKLQFYTIKPFLQLNIQETMNKLWQIVSKLKDFKTSNTNLCSLTIYIQTEINEINLLIESVKKLKEVGQTGKLLLKKKHWMLIMYNNNRQYKEDFTLQDLDKMKIISSCPYVFEVFRVAEYEDGQQKVVEIIQSDLKKGGLSLKMVKMPSSFSFDEIYLISEFDIVQQNLQEHQITLQKLIGSQTGTNLALEDCINEQLNIIKDCIATISSIIDAQKVLGQIEAMFSAQQIQKALSIYLLPYKVSRSDYKHHISDLLLKNSQLYFLIQNQKQINDQIECFLQETNLLYKALDDYFESRRLLFPRFFFMTDVQFLQFLELAESNLDFNHLVNLIFPGASAILIESTDNSIAPPYPSQHEEQQKQIKQVVGLISIHKELFMLNEPVDFIPQDVTGWLTKVEIKMQQTVGSLVSQAVGSFPKQSLDEWIMDYPLQTILTTIHLILTHEINELLSDKNQQEAASSHHNEYQDEYGIGANLVLDELHLRTPDTRDLVVATASSNNNRRPHQRTISLQQLQKEGIGQKGSHQRIMSCQQVPMRNNNEILKDRRTVISEVQVIDEEWVEFRKDMFGSDFELNDENNMRNVIVGIDDRDQTMKVLQDKSFKGLYLRLQFWINQICKSLRLSTQSDEGVVLAHHPLQRMAMQTIINFLSYMRDVVFELKSKGTSNLQDFDWQKQVRLTWQGSEESRGCKVDCGAWSTYQANEYIGNHVTRIPLTPLTNKYFVFISAALREKSAVLFRCVPSHDYCEDVLSDFANLCTVPFKRFPCSHKQVSMKSLMQYLNGAALASSWIFFEHIDRLDHVHLQSFNKEIQMVQQQFIIAELSQCGQSEQMSEGVIQQSLPEIQSSNISNMSQAARLPPMQRDRYQEGSIRSEKNDNGRNFNQLQRSQRSLISNDDYYEENKEVNLTNNSSHHRKAADETSRSVQNKVCFGVFASLSYRVSKNHEHRSNELSSSLQSAFRVLSLTRPELPLLTSMLLKSEGFLYCQVLSQCIHESVFRIVEDLLPVDSQFTALTVRELRRVTQLAGVLLISQSGDRREQEWATVREVVHLFMLEKLQSYQTIHQINDERLDSVINDILQTVFGIERKSQNVNDDIKLKQQLCELAGKRNLMLQKDDIIKLTLFKQSVSDCRPTCLVGESRTGKTEQLMLVVADLMKMNPIYFNSYEGTFREIYGIYDPVSQSQQAITEQMGPVKYPIIETLKSMIQKPKYAVILNGSLDSPLIESMLPLLEYQQFQEYYGKMSQQISHIPIKLPNGVETGFPTATPLIILARSLCKATPRLVSALKITNFLKLISDEQLLFNLQSHLSSKYSSTQIIDQYLLPLMKEGFNKLDLNYSRKVDTVRVAINTYTEIYSIISNKRKVELFDLLGVILITFVYSIGLIISKADQIQMFQNPIFKELKSKLGIDQSQCPLDLMFNPETLQLQTLDSQTSIPSQIGATIATRDFQRAYSFCNLLKNQNILLLGSQCASNLANHLCYQQSITIPQSCLLTFKTLRQVISSGTNKGKIHLFIEDVNMQTAKFFEQVRLNKLQVFHPDIPEMIPCNDFTMLMTQSTSYKQSMLKYCNTYIMHQQEDSNIVLQQTRVETSINKQVPMSIIRLDNDISPLNLVNMEISKHHLILTGYKQVSFDGWNNILIQVPKFRETVNFIQQICASITQTLRNKTKQVIVLNQSQLCDPSYYDFIAHLIKAIRISTEFDNIGYFQGLDLSTNGIISDAIHQADPCISLKEALAALNRDLRFVIVREEGAQYDELPLLKSEFFQLINKPSETSESLEEDVYSQMRAWILELSNLPYMRCDQKFIDFKRLSINLKEILSQSLTKQLTYLTNYSNHTSLLLERAISQDTQTLINKGHMTAFNLLNIQERFDVVSLQIKEKEQTVRGKEKEQLALKSQVEKRGTLKELIEKLRQFNVQEYTVLKNTIRDQATAQIVSCLCLTLQVKSIQELNLPDIVSRMEQLTPPKLTEQAKQALTQVKHLKKQLNATSLVAVLLGTLVELHSQVDIKQIAIIKESMSFNSSLIHLFKRQLTTLKEEAEDLALKEKTLKKETKRIELKDATRNLKNEHMMKAFIKQGKKCESKLDKVKIRLKNLEGDCLLLAASVVYLGIMPLEQRVTVRAEIDERLHLRANIETSQDWASSDSEQTQCKYFKRVITKDLKIKRLQAQNHMVVDSVIAEQLFFMIFATSMPVIFDQSGVNNQFITQHVLQQDTFNSRVVQVSASDYMTEQFLTQLLKQDNNDRIMIVNDLHDFSSSSYGRCQDLSVNFSGYLKCRVNVLLGNPSIDLPLIHLHSHSSHVNLSDHFLKSSSVLEQSSINKSEAWIDVKLVLLKHFLPESYQRLQIIISQTRSLKSKIADRHLFFDDLYLKVSADSVSMRDYKAMEDIRSCYIEVKQLEDDFQQFSQAFHQLINEHPLLASYSNIFVIMYLSMKELSRHTGEVTYSWRIFIKAIDMIIAKIIRDLTINMKHEHSEHHSNSSSIISNTQEQIRESGDPTKKEKEFTIDEDFFHSVIMPGIYAALIAGMRQEYVPLFNLLFSLEISFKKGGISQEQKDFFIKQFFEIKNCCDWRLNIHRPSTIPSGFISSAMSLDKVKEYKELKTGLLKIYPEMRTLFETIEIKLGKEFTYKELSLMLYQRMYKRDNQEDKRDWRNISLIKKINIGFLCPDDEWRSKICQFIYEELTTIFDFTEELSKLHTFIKTASWNLPIALLTHNSINIVNTVCSIASYYGVGLEVLRTDSQQTIRKRESYHINRQIGDNCQSQNNEPVFDEAAVLHHERHKTQSIREQQQNYQRMFCKDEFEVEEKQQVPNQQSQIELIQKCAETGTWVLISTLKFPTYWIKINEHLTRMAAEGKIMNTFRIFYDLQGYSMQEIPESFLFDSCVKFYLTDKNNEDMEGFNDVWANILNDDLLNAKELNNVYLLEGRNSVSSYQHTPPKMSIESHNSSMVESLMPRINHQHGLVSKGHDNSSTLSRKSLTSTKNDKSIILPINGFDTHISGGGRDVRSPRGQTSRLSNQAKIGNQKSKFKTELIIDQDQISQISGDQQKVESGLLSVAHSFINNHPIVSSPPRRSIKVNQDIKTLNIRNNNIEEIKQEVPLEVRPRYEIVTVKHPGKRLQPAQKH